MTTNSYINKGFSLIEILVSGAILALVFVGLATLSTYSIKSSDQAKVRTFATQLAQSKIDLFRFQRAMIGWGGLSEVLSSGSYCLNIVENSEQVIEFNELPSGELSQCGFEPVSSSDLLFKQVANVVVDAPSGEIHIEVVISWKNDKDVVVDARSSFVLRKDSRETSVFEPVVPAPTQVIPCAVNPSNATCSAPGNCSSCSCIAGWANCDGNWDNGCETELGTWWNCGSCGDDCSYGDICVDGSCIVP